MKAPAVRLPRSKVIDTVAFYRARIAQFRQRSEGIHARLSTIDRAWLTARERRQLAAMAEYMVACGHALTAPDAAMTISMDDAQAMLNKSDRWLATIPAMVERARRRHFAKDGA